MKNDGSNSIIIKGARTLDQTSAAGANTSSARGKKETATIIKGAPTTAGEKTTLSRPTRQESVPAISQVTQPEVPTGEEYFYNYELSWLKFNWRVLYQAFDEDTPLLERVKFIGIVCSNLDEFFQKRVGGLKRQLHAGVSNRSIDGMTPLEQLEAIRTDVKKMINAYRTCFFDKLIPAMQKEGIHFRSYDELTTSQKETLNTYFEKQLYPILTPLVVDHSHPFPLISNKSRSFAIELHDPESDERIFARIKIPNNRPRWLLAERTDDQTILVTIDDVISNNINRLFPGAVINSANIFRLTRSADIERNEEEADDLLEMIEDELRERRFAEVVRLEIDTRTPAHIKELLIEKMNISWTDIFEMRGPIGLADCMKLYNLEGYDHLKYKKWIPSLHPVFRHDIEDVAPDIFSIIKAGDFMVHHPYHSFATSVQRFVEEAAADPQVLAIKQTLYRTSKDSPLMHALMRAAESGKQVAVLVELKARFDEERNIEWAQRLEKAGVHVAYGLAGLKIHSKLTSVIREENGELCRYVHIGTGNYHPDTAQLYEDIGLFTCNEDIASDVTDLFNFLTGFAPEQSYKKLLVAPNYLRSSITGFIDFETAQARAGKKGRIYMKMNSLEDPAIIHKLYEAAKAGVQIDVMVRGVCRLKTGLPGVHKNLRIHSVIGRFLEHSRLYYFLHGGDHKYYIGSADMMHRNLDSRVEALTPIEVPALKQYLDFVERVYLADNRQRWIMRKDGNYNLKKVSGELSPISVHLTLMDHASKNLEPIPGGK
jgi:polyphosphate kinase